MGEGVERHVAGAEQELTEIGIARNVRPQHKRVEKAAEERLELDPLPIAADGADHEVVLRAVAPEEDLERREQQHEQGHPFAQREGAEPSEEAVRQAELHHASAEGLRWRAQVVEGQVDRRRGARELPAPVLELLAWDPLHLAPLPARKVGVLAGQIGQRRRLALAERVVQRRQLGKEDVVRRDSVEDHVMERQVEPGLVVVQADEQAAEERAAGEVERAASRAVAIRTAWPRANSSDGPKIDNDSSRSSAAARPPVTAHRRRAGTSCARTRDDARSRRDSGAGPPRRAARAEDRDRLVVDGHIGREELMQPHLAPDGRERPRARGRAVGRVGDARPLQRYLIIRLCAVARRDAFEVAPALRTSPAAR